MVATHEVGVAILIAALWGVAPIIHKHVIKKIDPRAVMVVGSFFYTTCLLMYWVYHRDIIHHNMKRLTTSDVLLIGCTAVFAGFLT